MRISPLPLRRLSGLAGLISLFLLTSAPGLAADTPSALSMGECPPATGDASLQLNIDNLRSGKGQIIVVIYGDKQSEFLAKGKRQVKVFIPAHAATLRACIRLPKPGTYALAAYHDEDGDRHLNRNLVGIPTEGYAFSNNPKTAFFGLPAFHSVTFAAKAGVTPMPLHIHYP